jgi:SAM-dependent methyltransferase
MGVRSARHRPKGLQSGIAVLKTIARWALRPKTLFVNAQFTRAIVRHYCRGYGCEIGPGVNPQAPSDHTFYVDRYTRYKGLPIAVDVVADAAALPFASHALDYLVSSHVLEHCPDTMRVIDEWRRVLRAGGVLVLRLPHRDRTFDRKRALTPLSHHLEDFDKGVGFDDATHWQEFLALAVDIFDHAWKQEARRSDGSYDIEYIVRNGHIHYHVWTQNEIVDLLRHAGMEIRFVIDRTLDRADSFLVVAATPANSGLPDPAGIEKGASEVVK